MPAIRKPFVVVACFAWVLVLAACSEKGHLASVQAQAASTQSYSVVVTYDLPQDDSAPFVITCTLFGENGEQLPPSQIPINSSGSITLTRPLKQPGTYLVTCSDDEKTLASTFVLKQAAADPEPGQNQFTTEGKAEITEPSLSGDEAPSSGAEAPAGSFAKPKFGDFTSGSLRMQRDQATTSQAGLPNAPCLPGTDPKLGGGSADFTVGPDGTLAGTCEAKNLTTGTLTGHWSENGDVTFTLEMKYEEFVYYAAGGIMGHSVYKTTWQSTSGAFTSVNVASGMAKWECTCTATGQGTGCYPDSFATTGSYNGTIPWTITFSK